MDIFLFDCLVPQLKSIEATSKQWRTSQIYTQHILIPPTPPKVVMSNYSTSDFIDKILQMSLPTPVSLSVLVVVPHPLYLTR